LEKVIMTFVSFVDRAVSPGGIVMGDIDLSDIFARPFDGVASDGSSATWTQYDTSVSPPIPDLMTEVLGEGLSEGLPGTLGGGTIFSITADLTDTTEMLVTSLNAMAGAVFARIDVNDAAGFWADALAFSDNISGSAGGDRLFALGGSDVIRGNGGNDVIAGGGGGDFLLGNGGRDVVYGGGGSDRIKGGGGNDQLSGGVGGDRLLGSRGQDALFGNGGDDRLSGGASEDVLTGGNGDDRLFGGSSADILAGGRGKDLLFGGAGADSFDFYNAETRSGPDRIADFSAGEDHITLINFAGLTVVAGTSTLASSVFVSGTAALDADDRVIWNSATGRLFYDPDGTGSAERIVICTLDAGTTVSADMIEAFSLAVL
jgi:Ca2+-binding RTX toxin-like protein